jgi:DNA-binding NarL/FixJ family response regulator
VNDPYIRDMLHAYRCGISINAIARAVGLSWLTVKRIVCGNA